MVRFKKKPIEEIKQPQEYYCSNVSCLNETAIFSPLRRLLTEEVDEQYSNLYCFDCIVDGKIYV